MYKKKMIFRKLVSPSFLSRTSYRFFSSISDDIPTLTEDQIAIQKLALDFAQQKLQPNSAEWDEKHYFPVDIIKEAAQYGFGAIICVPLL